MSVLSFPRIYFKGFMEWDPCTFNNNDWQAFPTYDPTNAALNWEFLKTQTPPITPENFGTTFRPWAIALQGDTEDDPAGARIPAEWNMFGTHDVSFLQYQDKITTVTGGALEYHKPVTNDPMIGKVISITGDNGGGSACLVDTNPTSFWSSQIYFGTLQLGDANTGVSGPRKFRMHSRWLNLKRIYSSTSELTQPAASVGACFQTCIPNDKLTWANNPAPTTGETSQLIATLQQAAAKPGAQGVMVRFTAYVNLYFQNGIFNNSTQQPRSYAELADVLHQAWQAWNTNGDTSQFFSQPCYSHLVGSIGVWNDGELASVPGGRYLAAKDFVMPIGGASPTTLGPVVANVDYQRNLVSLDLSSTIPEIATPNTSTSDLTKANFGELTLGTIDNGAFTPLEDMKICYESYQKAAYEASAGIIDVPISSADAAKQLQTGLLAIQTQSDSKTALAEQSDGYSAQTDQRGIYLDENDRQEFQVRVFKNGTPVAGAQVLIAKYDGNLSLIPSDQTQYVSFTNGSQQTIESGSIQTNVSIYTTDQSGDVTVGIESQAPGFPVLAFYPFAAGQPLPTLPAVLLGPPTEVPNNETISNAFYATVRVLPFDSKVPQQFIDLWNQTHDPAQAWDFIYHQILYVYDMLFNVMLEHVNLGDRSAVESSIKGVLQLTSKASSLESTFAMPITRDMSDGKRKALQLWGYLVIHSYQVPTLNPSALDSLSQLIGGSEE
ncbi:MAG: hypothetical protein ACKVZH_05145 [Blastocatellia bacterium]